VKTHLRARAWQLRAAVLAACLITTGTAYAATTPAAQDGDGGGVAKPAGGPAASSKVELTGRSSRHVRRGSRLRVRGTLEPALRGRTVRLQVRARHGWRTVDRARTRHGGRFRAAWRPRRPGRFRVRARFRGDGAGTAASRALRGRVYVYRPSQASWYGPGFYGGRTACGYTLTAGVKGVANRSLPCGTKVTFRHGGRSVTARVIDRGPFGGGREWDLTPATKRAIDFGSVGTVWATR
jgi:rare lipoprotein A